MSDALVIEDVRKRYGLRGPWALDGLSCSVPTGSICGLIGPNGAGKTTLFSVICGFLPADSGRVDVLGAGVFDPWVHKARLGALPQDALLPDRSTCRDFLRFMGMLQGMTGVEARSATEDALMKVDLRERADMVIANLSHGMRRRLSTASALLGTPELVLLDEPTAGLDPVQARQLRHQLVALRGQTTLVISSHNLAELERICDHVIFIEAGRCLRQGSLDALTRAGQTLRWGLGPGPVPLDALHAALPEHRFTLEEIEGARTLSHHAPLSADVDAATLVVMGALAQAGVPLRDLRRGQSLEESYIEGRG
ncbi:MAG: ABC transporter ATP-binding protein [Alphaproteobacteria bacterium]|nr:ABC transporter ATP-binding protein [Alphaproteobacteria bacterium]